MFTTKVHKIIIGVTLLVVLFVPNFAYAYTDSEMFYKRANVYMNNRQYNLAVTEYTKAIELDPQYAKAYHNRGLAYYFVGKNFLSIEDYTKAIELNPQYAKAYTNRGSVYHTLGRSALAIEDYTKVIQLNPNDVESYLTRAGEYESAGKDAAAIDDCNQVFRMNPNNNGAYNRKSSILQRRGEYTYTDTSNPYQPVEYRYNKYSMSRVNDPTYNPLR